MFAETKSTLAWFKFQASARQFRGPDVEHSRITLFNCRLVRAYIWEYLTHEDSRYAVEVLVHGAGNRDIALC